MDLFQNLILQLGDILNVPLHVDRMQSCRLNINGLLHVQLENDPAKERILIATFISDVPAGKFRENTFKECLKTNGVFPRFGTFAYSERNNKLALFEYLPYEGLSGEKLADALAKFIEKAQAWRSGMERGTIPPSVDPTANIDRSIFRPLA